MREILGYFSLVVLCLLGALAYFFILSLACTWALSQKEGTGMKLLVSIIPIALVLAPLVALTVWGLG